MEKRSKVYRNLVLVSLRSVRWILSCRSIIPLRHPLGTVTPRPQSGNEKPRVFRLTEDRAVINR